MYELSETPFVELYETFEFDRERHREICPKWD